MLDYSTSIFTFNQITLPLFKSKISEQLYIDTLVNFISLDIVIIIIFGYIIYKFLKSEFDTWTLDKEDKITV